MPKYLANLLLLIVAIVWGAAFIAQVTAMDSIGPMQFIGLRYILAAFAIAPIAFYEFSKSSQDLTMMRDHWMPMTIIGVVFFIASSMQQLALLSASVTNAGFLTGLYAVFTPVMLLFFRERPHPIIWPCAITSVIGVFMLGGGKLEGFTWGDVVLFFSSFFWGLQIILISRLLRKIGHPFFIVMTQLTIAGALGIALHLAAQPTMSLFGFSTQEISAIEPPFNLELLIDAIPELLYVALLSSAFAFSMQAVAQRYTSSSEAALLMSSESLFAALFAALLFNEQLSIVGYWGCALIFSAIIIVQVVPTIHEQKNKKIILK